MKKLYGRFMVIALISVMLFFYMLSLEARAANNSYYNFPMLPQQEVRGVVSDQNGIPLPGVTVLVKGKNRGTTTNIDGEYSLTIEPGDILIFSFLGYKTLEEHVNGRREIVIQLEEDISTLGEVQINAGYYNTTRQESTGNISRVTAEEIELQPVVSPLQALQGRVAGLEVIDQSGVPGAAPTIRIRGQNSLRNSPNNNGNLPLYIIDGVPMNSNPVISINQSIASTGTDPLIGINISNIESIEILKDADATAIYGSRGANGVILITTKGGGFKNREDNFEARVYSGISRVAHFVDLLETPKYLALRKQAFENDGVMPTANNARDLLLWDQERNTNWQEVFFGKSAPTLNANLNYSGGGENTSYSVGASYFKQGSVFPGDYSFEKKTVNLNLNHQSVNQKFLINLSLNYGINNNDLFSSNNFVSLALRLSPNAPEIYNNEGTLNWENSTWNNPFAVLESNGKLNSNNLVTNVGLQYRLTKDLSLKANLGYTHLDSEENILLPIQLYNPAIWNFVVNRSQHSLVHRKSWIAEPQLNYTTSINENNIDALVGATFQQDDNSQLRLVGTGYSDRHLIGNLGAANAVSVSEDRGILYKYNAIFARLGYNWNRTYFFNLTGRRDGSSRFGPNNRYANFGAVGTAWIFSNNQFISKNISFLSFGKLRGSYGITGNDQIGDYRYLDVYEATPGPGGLYPTQLTNPSFSWENNKKLEAAIELGFLQDRINLNLSWYRNRSSNQLVGYSLPAITGFNTVEANLPATVQNTGLEIEFSSLNIKNNNFQWRSSLNLSIPSNKLIEFENIERSSYANRYKIGEPLNMVFLYEFAGINPETGLFSVRDVNLDGSIDFNDQIISQNLGRQYFGGLNNQINYQNFSLGFLFEFVKQQGPKVYNNVPGFLGNIFEKDSDVWNPSNTQAQVQRPSQSINSLISFLNANASTYGITDASYVRLKTLSLGYNLPGETLRNLGLNQIQLFLHAQNLLTFTNYQGLDPQNPGENSLPVLQSITGGLQINF
ncbi:SusC/RagA family TonB-linked outer membrane protein [Antarcticibacterium arcticum]|uniref:SusC/RagA family TonB-linked outer membrane protein n=1 Tax=Antarcticibacterium arcticum TaxID=2585771 RepID=A0A5B8YJ74_9FLAO|nr:SusC/RagA family TonB-linked outer membrane protein [Antarcticibacterium arcticum]QED37775.1 SusC/RagA family TonB-linked outer membrane protein [Antarcticibacterium arcticum]